MVNSEPVVTEPNMKVESTSISFKTKGNADIIEIGNQVKAKVNESGIKNGTVTVFVTGSTGALTTIEYEPGLVEDLQKAMERIAPQDIDYAHDRRWGDGNGHAHVRASLIGPSVMVPLIGGQLKLGTWQQIIFIDFDNRPRSRELVVQIMGE